MRQQYIKLTEGVRENEQRLEGENELRHESLKPPIKRGTEHKEEPMKKATKWLMECRMNEYQREANQMNEGEATVSGGKPEWITERECWNCKVKADDRVNVTAVLTVRGMNKAAWSQQSN